MILCYNFQSEGVASGPLNLRGGFVLKGNAIVFNALLVLVLVLISSSIYATDFRTETFALRGTGSFMDSPPFFIGDIISGTLAPGTFWICFNDNGWPEDDPNTPNNERWDYIFEHYFVYDDTEGAEGWDGYFPPQGSGEIRPKWRFYASTNDTLGGECIGFVISIRDYDADGILDENEIQHKVISSNLVAYVRYSGGCFNTFCGQGNFSGTMDFTGAPWEEELYVPSESSASGRLLLKNDGCDVGVEDRSWGGIKAIYK